MAKKIDLESVKNFFKPERRKVIIFLVALVITILPFVWSSFCVRLYKRGAESPPVICTSLTILMGVVRIILALLGVIYGALFYRFGTSMRGFIIFWIFGFYISSCIIVWVYDKLRVRFSKKKE